MDGAGTKDLTHRSTALDLASTDAVRFSDLDSPCINSPTSSFTKEEEHISSGTNSIDYLWIRSGDEMELHILDDEGITIEVFVMALHELN